MTNVGIVVIGRNEGERLRRCLASVVGAAPVVYADSGSTDGSVALARALGVDVVELPPTQLYTAARGRNAGCAALLRRYPDLEMVQFLDGDCELVEGWLERGQKTLRSRDDVAVVYGRLRERQPEASIYNRLLAIEWDTPIGEVKAFGGNAMIRVAAFRQAGGFDPSLIGGEEADLYLRLRRASTPPDALDGAAEWKIFSLDVEMARHDGDMRSFDQWVRRSVRAGHAYAEGAWRHGRTPERHWVRESLSIVAWGAGLPALSLGLARVTRGRSLIALAAYPLLFARITLTHRRRLSTRHAALYAAFCILGKFPQLVGMLMFIGGRLTGRRALIEYKQTASRV